MPLLAPLRHLPPRQSRPKTRPDKVFEDFEHGYDKWKVEGNAFGSEPAKGTLPDQTAGCRFRGQGARQLVRGRRRLDRQAHQPAVHDRTQLHSFSHRRRIAARPRRSACSSTARSSASTSGRDDERLMPSAWDVREFAGRKAHIEIVDEAAGLGTHQRRSDRVLRRAGERAIAGVAR